MVTNGYCLRDLSFGNLLEQSTQGNSPYPISFHVKEELRLWNLRQQCHLTGIVQRLMQATDDSEVFRKTDVHVLCDI